ncbi:UNVERIFIED_CONTAM: helix-turn-helix transcriptional regulator [Streptococcus canis]|uniref:DNA-binding protein n=1 Tax=Streptococcus canis FSL Z3-227 TaxID=482234 RepID=A0AAV3FVL1_STRCB|nr:helix-turn-helix domain-containing protein [Streptococcus canis]EIQ82994.1 DNA-binding protein [Streptococcus canis FSL Z3-227]MDV5989303.1 helix-turn-helix transcriptional regulator [Streptococcus canis]MDV5992758.1 helix-turn-helix transcriptional regulator [Streptococcus canis]MDV6001809.1 helix-turn-helix transcriptional regulator [Streptococcus canis]MDV6022115.1 helix-turn-helix transcriptional regulator [Streptococcus canis]
MSVFARQLKKYRLNKNLSQVALAEQLFISRQAISKWENGDATPDLDHVVRLAEILEVSLDELVLGEPIDESIKNKNDEDNLNLLKGKEFVLNPETGKYEKRDGLTILLALLSELWWYIFFIPIILIWISAFF